MIYQSPETFNSYDDWEDQLPLTEEVLIEPNKMLFLEAPDEDFENFLSNINPDEFINEMLELGQISRGLTEYHEQVSSQCNNAVAWAIKRIMYTPFLYQIRVITGSFGGMDHTWIMAGDYYVDLTIVQFIENAPKIGITKIEENNKNRHYHPIKEFEPLEWAQEQKVI